MGGKDSNHSISLLRDESTHLSLDTPFINPSMPWLRPAGSSSGLVCLNLLGLRVRSNYIVVWNPATKQFRFLPTTDEWDDHRLLGFEFFHDSRNYKVVNIPKPGRDNTIRAKVFTSSTKSWREVKSHYYCSSGAIIGGTLSSITNVVLYSPLGIMKQTSHVLSFNLRDEVFHAIPLPESSISGQIDLLSWKNSLPFLGGPKYKPTCELWVMTEEPSAGTTQITWVKQFILEPSAMPGYIIGPWKDEYLLGDAISDDQLHCYDPASQKSTRLPKHDHTHRLIYEKAINYVETLVSVD
ncbi:PREDICTED: putative F-box protein At1g47790 [Fragaria vesca subsp. vesca]|uniref:putative F-box protein At1g47790 n=1 Tax=Fragaria vesca subsp. vesca TaxID=101020 RepID=UPI0002C3157D|nr:PREDICTED: putative F-box protein At1g47790 [Fragaria vesca subsp. vesca]